MIAQLFCLKRLIVISLVKNINLKNKIYFCSGIGKLCNYKIILGKM